MSLQLHTQAGSQVQLESPYVGNAGTLIGSNWDYTPVQFGNGAGVNVAGTNDDHVRWPMTTTALTKFTIEFWRKWESQDATDHYMFFNLANETGSPWVFPRIDIMAKGNSNPSPTTWNIDLIAIVRVSSSQNLFYLLDDLVVPTNVQQHIGLSFDLTKPIGQKIRFFLDGVEDTNSTDQSAGAEVTTYNWQAYFRIGLGYAHYFNLPGYIDNLKIYYDEAKTDFSDRFSEFAFNGQPLPLING